MSVKCKNAVSILKIKNGTAKKRYEKKAVTNHSGMKEGRIQKVALKSLKVGYVQVETPKLPRPCTLACNCKIIWVSDSGQVGEWSSKFQNHW